MQATRENRRPNFHITDELYSLFRPDIRQLIGEKGTERGNYPIALHVQV